MNDDKPNILSREAVIKKMINGQREVFPFEEKYTVENVAEKLGVSVEMVEKRLNKYFSSRYRHTKQYVLKILCEEGLDGQLSINKWIILKKDFIEQFYEQRKLIGRPIPDINFDDVPEIADTKTKYKLYIRSVSLHDKVIGDWWTSFDTSVRRLKDNFTFSDVVKRELTRQKRQDEFIEKSKKKFPGRFEYDRVYYINNHTEVELKCTTCGKYFFQTPNTHLDRTSGYCPDCARRFGKKLISQEDFIKKVKLNYGENFFDFSQTVFHTLREYRNNKYKLNYVTVIINDTGETRRIAALDLYTGRWSAKRKKSLGELKISECLTELGIVFTPEKQYRNIEQDFPDLVGIKSIIRVDFYIEYKNRRYIIEYNGEQHYKPSKYLHKTSFVYKNQVIRDKSLEKYCERNNIKLIVIPYTIKKKSKIKSIIIDGVIKNLQLNIKLPIPESYE